MGQEGEIMSFWCSRVETEYDHDSDNCSVCRAVYNARYAEIMNDIRREKEEKAFHDKFLEEHPELKN